MNSDRLKQLKAHLEEDPQDPFNHYALALEYRDAEPQLALQHFEHVLANHPDYLPAYYHACVLFRALDLRAKGLEVLQAGIALATRTGQLKTSNELLSLLEDFLF